MKNGFKKVNILNLNGGKSDSRRFNPLTGHGTGR
jgi:hypothetical protein